MSPARLPFRHSGDKNIIHLFRKIGSWRFLKIFLLFHSLKIYALSMKRMSFDGAERRRYPRTHICTNVQIRKGGFVVHGSLLNLSIGGILAEAEIRLIPEENEEILKVDAEINIDIPKLHLRALRGKILRVSSYGLGYQVAVEFTELKPEIAHKIIDRFAKNSKSKLT
ncbi:MAG: hypothetical protein COS94_05070 [Candidatus Hydrogenedentes bacterium CG07_land_8_20_14_0_80_42_17]|nr:MAG: hypothetical protein COS94_05070 [Candidatus Hydrogenedentes bacterium CG07_land_8_20_14_0_80_42_17]